MDACQGEGAFEMLVLGSGGEGTRQRVVAVEAGGDRGGVFVLDEGGGEVAIAAECDGDGGGDGFAEGGEGEGTADRAFVLASDGESEGRGA